MVRSDILMKGLAVAVLGFGVATYISQKDFGDLADVEDVLRQGEAERRVECRIYEAQNLGGSRVKLEECLDPDGEPSVTRLWVTSNLGDCSSAEYVLQQIRSGPYQLRGPENSALIPFGGNQTCYNNAALELIARFRE